jgi:excisionase family DNA binding protein
MDMHLLSHQSPHDPNTSLPQSQQITMSVDETMAALSIGRTMVYSLIRSHAIRTIKIGKKRLIIVASIHEYISDLESYGIGELGGE